MWKLIFEVVKVNESRKIKKYLDGKKFIEIIPKYLVCDNQADQPR